MTACSSDDNRQSTLRSGSLSVNVVADNVVTVAGTSGLTEVSGYTTDGEDIFLTMASADGMYGHEWKDFEQFPQGQFYIAGTYALTAGCGMEEMEGFNVPSFYGTAEV
ncbi:MAG: DUF4493 domain-containing protein, partial [Duncaniella sp.]|nr:DUF4493 domain-containing protein [Duncaniella sp.]